MLNGKVSADLEPEIQELSSKIVARQDPWRKQAQCPTK